MYLKEDLPYELGRIQKLWESEGHFALHHDLTLLLHRSWSGGEVEPLTFRFSG